MSNKKPVLPPIETRFKPRWKSGKTKQVSIPIAIAAHSMLILHCIDKDPAIASQVLEYAQSLLAE